MRKSTTMFDFFSKEKIQIL